MTYGRAVAILLPGFLALVFAQLVFIPKVNAFWNTVADEMNDSYAGGYLLVAFRIVPEWMPYIIGATILGFTALELGVKAWPRWRSLVTTILVVIFNAVLLFGLVSITITGLLVGPMAGKKMALKKASDTKMPAPDSQER